MAPFEQEPEIAESVVEALAEIPGQMRAVTSGRR